MKLRPILLLTATVALGLPLGACDRGTDASHHGGFTSMRDARREERRAARRAEQGDQFGGDREARREARRAARDGAAAPAQ